MTDMEKALNQNNEFLAALLRQLPSMTTEVRQGWIEDPLALKKVLAELAPSKKMVTVVISGINHAQSNSDAVKATKRNLFGNIDHADNLPHAEGDSETITFVPIEKTMSPDEADALVAEGGFEYASFLGLCKHNQDNPGFAKGTPHFTQGKDKEGRHSYAGFSGWDGGRSVSVRRYECDWDDDWFVAVVPASPEDSDT